MYSALKPKLEVLVGPEENLVIVPSEHADSLEAFLRRQRLSLARDRKAIVCSIGTDDILEFYPEENVRRLQSLLERWSLN